MLQMNFVTTLHAVPHYAFTIPSDGKGRKKTFIRRFFEKASVLPALHWGTGTVTLSPSAAPIWLGSTPLTTGDANEWRSCETRFLFSRFGNPPVPHNLSGRSDNARRNCIAHDTCKIYGCVPSGGKHAITHLSQRFAMHMRYPCVLRSHGTPGDIREQARAGPARILSKCGDDEIERAEHGPSTTYNFGGPGDKAVNRHKTWLWNKLLVAASDSHNPLPISIHSR